MKTTKRKIIIAVICMIFTSCNDLFLGPDPEDTLEKNFELLWNDFDKTYSFFVHKKINWDSLYAVYHPQVINLTKSEQILDPQAADLSKSEQLFNIVSEMLDHLKDGHVDLFTPYGNYSYPWDEQFPENFIGLNKIKLLYLNLNFKENGVIHYGLINKDIGYIYIQSFGNKKESYKIIDTIMKDFNGSFPTEPFEINFGKVKGIVVDVRNNGGGSEQNAKLIASRFADQRRLYRYTQFRNGPKHSDFTTLVADYIEPAGKVRFTKPVMLLTNRGSFSSAETFIQAMKTFPHVTSIGDTSGGGTGNPINRELPNGWTYRLPRWIQYTSDKRILEGIGIPPDIPARITDYSSGRDTILDTAVDTLIEHIKE